VTFGCSRYISDIVKDKFDSDRHHTVLQVAGHWGVFLLCFTCVVRSSAACENMTESIDIEKSKWEKGGNYFIDCQDLKKRIKKNTKA
jgi:hypothetical protein